MSKTKQTFGGALVLLGLLAMVSIEPGQAIGPYIAVMALALSAVVAGARFGGFWRAQKRYKKAPPEMAVSKRHKDKYTSV